MLKNFDGIMLDLLIKCKRKKLFCRLNYTYCCSTSLTCVCLNGESSSFKYIFMVVCVVCSSNARVW